MKKNTERTDVFVIGLALFSMYFGSGNVIFPPYLGMELGSKWFAGFLGYYLSDIGLAFLALFSILKLNSAEEILRPIGAVSSKVFMCAIALCLGPMVAIPRCGVTTYELSIAPLAPWISTEMFSLIFFAIAFFICLNKNSVVDIIGKFLTPILLVCLILLIVKGCISPLGKTNSAPKTDGILISSVKTGYQTMDVLATMMFGRLVLETAENRGYSLKSKRPYILWGAVVIASVVLAVVYMGLVYLGATASECNDLSVNRAVLVTEIVYGLLGKTGLVIFSVVVALACLTTSVSLLSSTVGCFRSLFSEKIPHRVIVGFFCIFSAITSNIGLDRIIAIAVPILDIMYPPVLVLVAFSYVKKDLPSIFYRMAAGGAALFSVIYTISNHFGYTNTILSVLPFSSIGCGWILPSLFCGIIGYLGSALLPKATKKK